MVFLAFADGAIVRLRGRMSRSRASRRRAASAGLRMSRPRADARRGRSNERTAELAMAVFLDADAPDFEARFVALLERQARIVGRRRRRGRCDHRRRARARRRGAGGIFLALRSRRPGAKAGFAFPPPRSTRRSPPATPGRSRRWNSPTSASSPTIAVRRRATFRSSTRSASNSAGDGDRSSPWGSMYRAARRAIPHRC